MKKEIEANKKAWNLLAKDHYDAFKKILTTEKSNLTEVVTKEIGDIKGKKLIHLQCNTGADTLSLARLGAEVTGVDLAPDNILYAKKLAEDLGINNARFIESDILELQEIHNEKYDIVFTSEGAIGWLPDLKKWAQTVRSLLKDDGFFYVNDGHPLFMIFDEDLFVKNKLEIKYPYFIKRPDLDNEIGGYASESKEADNYFWMYTVGEIINALVEAGLVIEYFHEFDTLCYDLGDMEKISRGIYRNQFFKDKLPMHFSLKATVRKK